MFWSSVHPVEFEMATFTSGKWNPKLYLIMHRNDELTRIMIKIGSVLVKANDLEFYAWKITELAPWSIWLKKIVHAFLRCAEIRVLQIFDLLIRWKKNHNSNRSQCQRTSSNQTTAKISTWNSLQILRFIFIFCCSCFDAKRMKKQNVVHKVIE